MHSISPVDRMSAVILAKSIVSTRALLEMKNELPAYVRRLYKYRMFTVSEICDFSGMTEYAVRKAIAGEPEFRAKPGIKSSHLDHIVRMVGSNQFAKLHTKSLIKDGATIASLSRVTGISETTLRRYEREEK